MSIQFYGIYGQPVTAPSDMVMLGDMVPDCGGVKFQGYKNGMLYHLLVNGELLIPESGLTFGMDQYCMEDRYQNGKHLPLFLICQGGNTVMKVKNRLQIFGDMVTIIFLTVTTVFHILIPSLRDTQDLCFISHIVAMGVAYIFLLIFSLSLHAISKGFCIVGGIIFNYSFLAMFFWLNIMCFDIWRVIRQTTRGIPLIGILSNGTKKFRLYCLFGWGVPLVVTAVASIIYLLPEEHTKNLTVPRFGRDICWLTGEMELLVYCYSFVGALFILDLILIGHTMVMLFQAGNAFMYFSKQVSGNAFNRKYIEAFWQRFSLFVLMVLCWTTDLLSWKIPPKEIWLVTDIINSLQGFLVFIIFISNAKRRGMVRDLFKKAPLPCFKATPLTSN
ncbi:probable G-protein coupled receptor Mth-like 4 isoform X2 [Scylla paramamosain]